MLELLDRQTRLTGNQKKIVAAAVIGDMLDYFDFGLIGFALAFIVGPWKLTYGQSAMILLTSGIGGVPGALFYGWLADRIGRRTVFIITALNFSLATGVMALTPDHGGWIFSAFAVFSSVLVSRACLPSTCHWCRNSCRRQSGALSVDW